MTLITIKPYDNIKMPQAKKNRCKQCTTRHSPPTGKKCRYVQQETSDVEDSGLFRDAAVKGGSPSADPVSGQLIQQQILQQLQKVNQRLDKVEHRMAEEEDTRERSRGKLSTDTSSQAGKSKSRKQLS